MYAILFLRFYRITSYSETFGDDFSLVTWWNEIHINFWNLHQCIGINWKQFRFSRSTSETSTARKLKSGKYSDHVDQFQLVFVDQCFESSHVGDENRLFCWSWSKHLKIFEYCNQNEAVWPDFHLVFRTGHFELSRKYAVVWKISLAFGRFGNFSLGVGLHENSNL